MFHTAGRRSQRVDRRWDIGLPQPLQPNGKPGTGLAHSQDRRWHRQVSSRHTPDICHSGQFRNLGTPGHRVAQMYRTGDIPGQMPAHRQDTAWHQPAILRHNRGRRLHPLGHQPPHRLPIGSARSGDKRWRPVPGFAHRWDRRCAHRSDRGYGEMGISRRRRGKCP